MARNFPTYQNHDAVKCFNCGGDTGKVRDCEYPQGHGQYRKTCEQCGYHTYYDVPRQERVA